jgi:putative ABC transport system ATP-binding protein
VPDETAARLVSVSRTYGAGAGSVHALREVTLTLPAGSFTALMGPSGSGKTTCIQCLAGLDRPSSGQVFIGDREISRLRDPGLTRLRRRQVGFVFQAFNLVPYLNVRQNVVLPMRLDGRREDRAWVSRVLERVGLANRERHRPSELSGGQQQRVAVARALASRPTIVFADEPTGSLDIRSGREILGLLRAAVDELRQTVVMVTHDPSAAATADRVHFLADGRLVKEIARPTVDAVSSAMLALEG